MNYLKTYISLCKTRKTRTIEEYTEKHHVFPESIYGKNEFVVSLTHREHYIAHLLLWKMCKNRYGVHNWKTRKMAIAFHMMVYCVGDTKRQSNLFSRYYQLAKIASRESKLGKKRKDLQGKKYFGASEETIKNGIEKMRLKKIGQKINYPKNRKTSSRNGAIAEKISQSRLKTKEKYLSMSDKEFEEWILNHKLILPSGRKNSNVTRALKWREELNDEKRHKSNDR